MKKQTGFVRTLVIIGVLLVSAFALMSNTRAGELPGDLTTLSAGDASAVRWEAMARFYLERADPDLTEYYLSERGAVSQPADLSTYFRGERLASAGGTAMAVYQAGEWSR